MGVIPAADLGGVRKRRGGFSLSSRQLRGPGRKRWVLFRSLPIYDSDLVFKNILYRAILRGVPSPDEISCRVIFSG
jgi:hypothetical protein